MFGWISSGSVAAHSAVAVPLEVGKKKLETLIVSSFCYLSKP